MDEHGRGARRRRADGQPTVSVRHAAAVAASVSVGWDGCRGAVPPRLGTPNGSQAQGLGKDARPRGLAAWRGVEQGTGQGQLHHRSPVSTNAQMGKTPQHHNQAPHPLTPVPAPRRHPTEHPTNQSHMFILNILSSLCSTRFCFTHARPVMITQRPNGGCSSHRMGGRGCSRLYHIISHLAHYHHFHYQPPPAS